MNREEATALIIEAKRAKQLTFEAIAQVVGRHKVWTTAALLGQASMSAEEAERVVALLGLEPEVRECCSSGSAHRVILCRLIGIARAVAPQSIQARCGA